MRPAHLLLRSAARWLLVVLPLGVWLRSAFVWARNPGPFTWAPFGLAGPLLTVRDPGAGPGSGGLPV